MGADRRRGPGVQRSARWYGTSQGKRYSFEDVLLIAEVVSVSSARKDYDDCTAEYGRYGIPVYLVVDPYAREVVVHTEPTGRSRPARWCKRSHPAAVCGCGVRGGAFVPFPCRRRVAAFGPVRRRRPGLRASYAGGRRRTRPRGQGIRGPGRPVGVVVIVGAETGDVDHTSGVDLKIARLVA
ncbi:Uma2 family endonuclease [Streptomyces sp. SCSIO 30461]|uniref:Uma2 family endonuclease n=1 Tax=Streptomyces sp. SCSIO 30461 TaxID=3118085 RepID=UPI0030D3DB0E